MKQSHFWMLMGLLLMISSDIHKLAGYSDFVCVYTGIVGGLTMMGGLIGSWFDG